MAAQACAIAGPLARGEACLNSHFTTRTRRCDGGERGSRGHRRAEAWVPTIRGRPAGVGIGMCSAATRLRGQQQRLASSKSGAVWQGQSWRRETSGKVHHSKSVGVASSRLEDGGSHVAEGKEEKGDAESTTGRERGVETERGERDVLSSIDGTEVDGGRREHGRGETVYRRRRRLWREGVCRHCVEEKVLMEEARASVLLYLRRWAPSIMLAMVVVVCSSGWEAIMTRKAYAAPPATSVAGATTTKRKKREVSGGADVSGVQSLGKVSGELLEMEGVGGGGEREEEEDLSVIQTRLVEARRELQRVKSVQAEAIKRLESLTKKIKDSEFDAEAVSRSKIAKRDTDRSSRRFAAQRQKVMNLERAKARIKLLRAMEEPAIVATSSSMTTQSIVADYPFLLPDEERDSSWMIWMKEMVAETMVLPIRRFWVNLVTGLREFGRRLRVMWLGLVAGVYGVGADQVSGSEEVLKTPPWVAIKPPRTWVTWLEKKRQEILPIVPRHLREEAMRKVLGALNIDRDAVEVMRPEVNYRLEEEWRGRAEKEWREIAREMYMERALPLALETEMGEGGGGRWGGGNGQREVTEQIEKELEEFERRVAEIERVSRGPATVSAAAHALRLGGDLAVENSAEVSTWPIVRKIREEMGIEVREVEETGEGEDRGWSVDVEREQGMEGEGEVEDVDKKRAALVAARDRVLLDTWLPEKVGTWMISPSAVKNAANRGLIERAFVNVKGRSMRVQIPGDAREFHVAFSPSAQASRLLGMDAHVEVDEEDEEAAATTGVEERLVGLYLRLVAQGVPIGAELPQGAPAIIARRAIDMAIDFESAVKDTWQRLGEKLGALVARGVQVLSFCVFELYKAVFSWVLRRRHVAAMLEPFTGRLAPEDPLRSFVNSPAWRGVLSWQRSDEVRSFFERFPTVRAVVRVVGLWALFFVVFAVPAVLLIELGLGALKGIWRWWSADVAILLRWQARPWMWRLDRVENELIRRRARLEKMPKDKKKKEFSKPTVKIADLPEAQSVKPQLQECVMFLRHPERYKAIGARPPRGLAVPADTGEKLAEAIAGEARVPMLRLELMKETKPVEKPPIQGPFFADLLKGRTAAQLWKDWWQGKPVPDLLDFALAQSKENELAKEKTQGKDTGQVGEGASRVRAVFKRAREMAPVVIFANDLEMAAPPRSGTLDLQRQEQESMLNQLLVELDGFATEDKPVLFVAAIENPENVDPALVRPGRIDRQIFVPIIGDRERAVSLRMHAGDAFADDIDWEELSERLVDYEEHDIIELLEFCQKYLQQIKANALSPSERMILVKNCIALQRDWFLRLPIPDFVASSNWYQNILKKKTMELGLYKEKWISRRDMVDALREYTVRLDMNDTLVDVLDYAISDEDWTYEYKHPHAIWAAARGLVALLLPDFDNMEVIWLDRVDKQHPAWVLLQPPTQMEHTGVFWRSYAEKHLVLTFAPYVANQWLKLYPGGDTLAHDDIQKANRMCAEMVLRMGWGPTDKPMVWRGILSPNHKTEDMVMGPAIMREVQAEAEILFNIGMFRCMEILKKNRHILEELVELLIEKEKLFKEDILEVMHARGAVFEEEPFILVRPSHLESQDEIIEELAHLSRGPDRPVQAAVDFVVR